MATSSLVPWFLTDCAENEHYNRSFFFLTFCSIINAIYGIVDHHCIMEALKFKKSEKKEQIKNNKPYKSWKF